MTDLHTVSVGKCMYGALLALSLYTFMAWCSDIVTTLQRHKSPGIHQIPAELMKQGVEQFALRSISLLIRFGIRRNCLRCGRSQSLYLFITRAIQQIVVIMQTYHFCQLHTFFYQTSCCQGELHMQRKLLGIINVDFDTTGQLLVIYFAFIKYLRNDENKMKQCISYLQTSNRLIIQLGGKSCIILSLSLVSP